MSHKIYTTQSEADYFTLNKRSWTECSCGQTSCIRLDDEEETIIVICDECANNSSDSFSASEILRMRGNRVDWSTDYDAILYTLDGYEYVCLFDNSVITREEDNQWGKDEAIFPY